MSTTQGATQTAAGGCGWIELHEAARRSGRSAGHLRRQCVAAWLADGRARQVGGGGKRSRWQVREDADPSLARVKFPEQIGTDLRSVPESKRKEALRRKTVLDAWWIARRGGLALGFAEAQVTAQYLNRHEIETGERLCRATLFRWEARWRAGGLAALVDRRGAAKEAGEVDPFLAEVERLYLSVRKLKLTVCREIALLKAEQHGWPVRSYTTCQRHVDAIPRAVVLKYRFGDEAFVNEAEPSIERSYAPLSSNEIWCADHHQFDVIVNAGGKLVRPWLTAWQDLRSRKIVGWRIFAHDPSSDPILAAFRAAVLEHGVPRQVYVDNGKDFDCYALQGRTKADRWLKRRVRFELDETRAGVFPGLGIGVIHAWPYHGQSKPIERWFGTAENYTPVWPTYCGNSTAAKPEDLQLQLERGKAPTLADFTDWFAAWIETYHADAHLGDGMDGRSPNQVYAEHLDVKRTATPEAMDVYCLRQAAVKVGQNGVTFQGLRYGQHELIEHLGRDVVLRIDDRDLSRVQVWTADGRFLTLAHANQRVPANATRQELREAIGAKRKARQFVREYMDVRPRLADDLPDLIVRAKARAAAEARAETGNAGGGDEPTPPPAIRPVRSEIEGQLPALRRAVEASSLRKAVGAEGASSGFIYARPAASGPRAAGETDDAPASFRELMRARNTEAGHE